MGSFQSTKERAGLGRKEVPGVQEKGQVSGAHFPISRLLGFGLLEVWTQKGLWKQLGHHMFLISQLSRTEFHLKLDEPWPGFHSLNWHFVSLHLNAADVCHIKTVPTWSLSAPNSPEHPCSCVGDNQNGFPRCLACSLMLGLVLYLN